MGKHPAYLFLLASFLLALWILPGLNKEADKTQITVGYVIEEQEDISEQGEILLDRIEEKLSSREEAAGSGLYEDSLFFYKKYEDQEELKREMITGEISCGVVFGEKFSKKLTEQDYHNCIALFLPEGMNVGGMVQEDLFRKVYQVYSAIWYSDQLKRRGYSIEPETVLEKFSEYQEQGRVFAVEYRRINGEEESVSEREKAAPFLSLRGILAFLTLLSASLGAMDGSRDREKGTGKGLPHAGRLTAAVTGVPILFAVIFLAGGMLTAGETMAGLSGTDAFRRIFAEAGCAFGYGIILWAGAALCGRFFSERQFAAVTPCFLLLILLCCPVFFDLRETVPAIGYLSELFPVTWYLKWCRW